MKSYFMLLSLMMLVSLGLSQSHIPRVVSTVSITNQAARTLKQSAELPSSLVLVGNQVKAAKGMLLFGGEGRYLVMDISNYQKLVQEDEKALITAFQDMGQGSLPNGVGNWYLYCSCGSKVTDSAGDDCGFWGGGAPNVLVCRGKCSQGNEGSSCSFTGLHVFADGTTKIIDQF